MFLNKVESMSTVTKKVIDDFNRMDDKQFMAKYFCSKLTYAKRVAKYGDPYMKSPLAKIGKFFIKYSEVKSKEHEITEKGCIRSTSFLFAIFTNRIMERKKEYHRV